METNTVTISEQTYMIGRMDTMKQFHVARRLAPILAGMGSVFGEGKDRPQTDEAILGAALPNIADALSKMSDEDVEYIIKNCMAVCKRKSEQGPWSPVQIQGRFMFADIQMEDMLKLSMEVIQFNLGSFFPSGAPDSQAGAATKS